MGLPWVVWRHLDMALSGLQDMMNTLNLDVKDNYDMFLKQYHQQTRPSP
jgi:hypothetical protein